MAKHLLFLFESKKLQKILRTAFLFYVAISASVIIYLLVDIPHMDEWEWLTPRFMGAGWSNPWFWGFANEHREIPTWLMAMLNLELFGLDFRLQMVINLAIYYGLIWTVWRTIGKPIDSKFTLVLLAPFLSSLNFENHTMSEQNCIHISLWTFLGGTYYLYYSETTKKFLLGTGLLVVSVFSCASGIPATILSYLIFILWIALQRNQKKYLATAIGAVVLVIGIYLWFLGYTKPGSHPPITYPWDLRFFKGIAEMVSLGFGHQNLKKTVPFLCLGIVVFLSIKGLQRLIKNSEATDFRRVAFLLSLVMGILAILGSIAMGRIGFGYALLKSSRYFEYAVFLPILTFALMTMLTPRNRFLFWLLFALLIGGSFDDFGFRRYINTHHSRVRGKECVLELLRNPDGNLSGVCKDTYPWKVRDRVQLAHHLGVKFTKAADKN